MVLEKRIVDIPLTGGLDEGKAEIYIEPPSWSYLHNARFTKRGYMEQRPAYLPGTVAAAFFAKRGSAPVARKLLSLSTYSEDQAAWSDTTGIGGSGLLPVVALDVSARTLANGVKSPSECDIARSAADGTELTIWRDGGLIYAQFRDADGNPIGGPSNLTASGAAFTSASFGRIRACCVGTTFAVFAASDANALYGWTGSAISGAASWSSSTTVRAATAAPFDADSNDDDDEFILAYWNGTATVLERLNASLASQATQTISSSTGASAVGVKYDSGRVIALYNTVAGDLYAASYSDTFGTTHFGHTAVFGTSVGMVSPAGLSAALSGSTWHITCFALATYYNTMTTGGTAGATVTSALGPVAIGTIFVHNSTAYIPTIAFGWEIPTRQPTGLLLAVYGGSGSGRKLGPVARFGVDRLTSTVGRARTIRTANVTAQSAATFATAALESMTVASSSATALTTAPSAVGRYAFDFPGGSSSFAEYDGNLYFGGGQLWCFDGVHAAENTPHQFPTSPSVTFSGSSGFLSAGDYAWKAVYEWEDANGVLHRSAPSLSVTGTATSTQTAKVKVPKLYATARDNAAQLDYQVSLYRTEVGGSVFYLCQKWKASDLASTTLGYWDVDDGLADADLGELLYTEGGVLEATAPPPVWDMTIARGRMWIVSADRRNELWYSKKLTRGIAPEFNAAQVIDVPGEIMCVRGMDDKIVALCSDGIFAIYGDGPNDTGNGGTFTEPQAIASPTGCKSRETVSTGSGIVFGGVRGAYSLGRGLDVQWIGEAPGMTTGAFVGACRIESNNEILLNDGSTLYVLNADSGQWGTWSIPTTTVGNAWAMLAIDSAGLPERVYVAQRSDSAIISCDPADTYDTAPSSDATIAMEARTGYIRPGSVNGRQRVWRVKIGYVKTGDVQLRISFGGDAESLATFRTYTNAELDTAGGFLDIHLPSTYQRANGLRIGFLAVASTGFGAIQITSLTTVIGVRPGTRSLPSTSRG